MFLLRSIFLLMANLNFASYNSRGLGEGRMEYIKKLVDNNDFILIQEHWQMTDQLDIFQ